MSYSIIPTDNFKKEAKKLAKKHLSLKSDLQQLRASLTENPNMGTHLGSGIYKIRIAISSKGKGKSAGARVISFVFVKNEQVFLLSIYDKSEREDISNNEIKALIKNLPM